MRPIILGGLLLAYGTVAVIVGAWVTVYGSDDPRLSENPGAIIWAHLIVFVVPGLFLVLGGLRARRNGTSLSVSVHKFLDRIITSTDLASPKTEQQKRKDHERSRHANDLPVPAIDPEVRYCSNCGAYRRFYHRSAGAGNDNAAPDDWPDELACSVCHHV